MKPKKNLIFILVIICLLFFDLSADALDYQLGVEIFEGVFVENNYPDEATATFDYDETFNILGVYPEGHADFGGGISAHALGELEWFHSWDADDAGDANDVDVTLANAFLTYSGAGVSADAGRVPFYAGNGMLVYADEPGIALRYDGWKNMFVTADAIRIFDRSAMAKLSLGYVPGFLESVEMIGAWYHDADDRVADLYEPFYDDGVLESTGDLFWVGAQANLFVYDLVLSCLMLHQFGSVEIDDGSSVSDFDVAAYLIDVEINYNVLSRLSLAPFVFAASGDDTPQSGKLHAFMSPMPFNQRAAIFFNGGFERYDVEEAVRLGGVTWDGVIAPGVKLEYQPIEKIIAEIAAVILLPQGDLFNQDTWYGWEADSRLSYEFYPAQRLFVEAGIFTHGKYFEQATGYRPSPATRVVAGVSLIF